MDNVEKLKQLKQLFDEGILSQEEFESRKERILFPEAVKEEPKVEVKEETTLEKTVTMEQVPEDHTSDTTTNTIKRKCPNCGAVVESKFCTSCGHDLTGADVLKICPNCGTETTAKFCTGCGTRLIDEVPEAIKTAVSSASKPVASTGNVKESGITASDLVQRAKKLGAQKVKDLEQSAETKRALKEKEAELLREKQEREAALLREKQEREEELRRLQEKREAEERERQLEETRKKAREKEEYEKRKKIIEQKRVYEEADTYLSTASKSDDHGIAAGFYRKAEELFASIPGVEDADEKSLFAARKAKEQEVIIEAERIKAVQQAKAEAAAKAAEEAKPAENRLKESTETTDRNDYQEADAAEIPESVVKPQEEIIDDTTAVAPEKGTKASGKSKSKIIIAIAAVAVLAIAGIIFGLSRNGTDETVQTDDLSSAEVVTSDQLPTELVSSDNLKVTAKKATYTEGASDIRFEIAANNNTNDILGVILTDVVIDDVTVPVEYDGSEDAIENGDWDITRDVYLDDVLDAGVADFENISCSMIVTLNGKALQKTELSLNREDFSEIEVDLPSTEVDNSNKTVEISKKNLAPVIASNDKYSIAIYECTYSKSEGAYIDLEVNNDSKELIYIYMEDLMIDDSSIKTTRDASPIQVGETYSGLLVYTDDIKAAGVEDFKEMTFTMVVKVGDEESLKQNIHITRDGFITE